MRGHSSNMENRPRAYFCSNIKHKKKFWTRQVTLIRRSRSAVFATSLWQVLNKAVGAVTNSRLPAFLVWAIPKWGHPAPESPYSGQKLTATWTADGLTVLYVIKHCVARDLAPVHSKRRRQTTIRYEVHAPYQILHRLMFWILLPSSFVDMYYRFGSTCCHQITYYLPTAWLVIW
jgi:hypothetical protein